MSSASSSTVFRRFFLPPSTSLNKGFTEHPTLRPIPRPFRILESKPPKNVREYVQPVAKSLHKFSIFCSGHEHNSSEPPKPDEGISRHLPEELMQSEFSHSSVPRTDSDSTPQKKSANTVLTIFGKQWDVPWGAETILQVMLLWAAALWFIDDRMIPYAAHKAGFNRESSTFRGHALYGLVTQVTNGLTTIAILRLCLSRYCPLPPDWFRFSLKGKWQLDVILGCLMFPLAKRLSRFNLNFRSLLPSRPELVSLSGVERSIGARDHVAMALYVIRLSICTPVWEEILFRGFLLPSLTKYMPVWCAILVSSVAFALGHFNLPKILSLTFLSFLMGVTFSRSRNLLPSILLHSLWNSLAVLYEMKVLPFKLTV